MTRLWASCSWARVSSEVTIRDFIERPQLRLLDGVSLFLLGALALWRGFLDPAVPLYFLGRGPALASVREAVLVMHETAKMPAVGMSSAEFRNWAIISGNAFCRFRWTDSTSPCICFFVEPSVFQRSIRNFARSACVVFDVASSCPSNPFSCVTDA